MRKKTRSMRIKLARCKQTVEGETEHNTKEMKMVSARKPESFVLTGNEVELLLRLTLNYKACSCKKDSVSSAARTLTCSPPLLLLLWVVAGFRGQRQEVEGWGNGVIVSESMQIRRPHENGRAAFSDFSTLRPGFKKVCFQALHFQDPCGRSAKTMQYMSVFAKEHFRVYSAQA